MSEVPNLGVNLLRIHSILTRGLTTSIQHAQEFAKKGFPSISTQHGFFTYVQSFLTVLDGHHQLEDEMAFPYLREKLPDGPYDLLTAQHGTLLPIAAQVKINIEELTVNPENRGLLQKLGYLLGKVDEFWRPHIRIEEEFFTVEKVGAAISSEEQIRIGKLFMEHTQKHTGPDFLILPFMLYNLPKEQRTIFTEMMPPIVTEQLIPVVWKDKWEPMTPFLLA